MCDIDHGNAQRLLQMLDLDLHMLPQLLIERPERFVHQHQRRLKHQRARQRHTLLLPAGQLARLSAAKSPKLDTVQRLFNPLSGRSTLDPAIAQRKSHIFGHAHMRKQGIILKNEADIALLRRKALNRLAVQQNMALRGLLEAAQHHQCCGFSRAGRPEHGEELTPLHR